MPAFFIEISGGEELARRLELLPAKVGGDIVKAALKAAAAPIQAAAKAAAPVDTGLLQRSIRVRMFRKEGSRFSVGVSAVTTRKRFAAATGRKSRGGANDAYEVFYAHFLEYGHKLGSLKAAKRAGKINADRGTDARRDVPAQPFVRPAFDANVDRSAQILEDIDAAL